MTAKEIELIDNFLKELEKFKASINKKYYSYVKKV